MNTVDSMENFLADVAQGRWEAVLPQVAGLRLPQEKLLGACVTLCDYDVARGEAPGCVRL